MTNRFYSQIKYIFVLKLTYFKFLFLKYLDLSSNVLKNKEVMMKKLKLKTYII